MAKKTKLIIALKEIFPNKTKDELFAMIACGDIYYKGNKETDAQRLIDSIEYVTLKGNHKIYASRGGYKLESAINFFNFNCTGMVFLDAGCSTGGFTDCLLQHGALGVHAVDVGYNQLIYSLREDPRVYVHEKTNVMSLENLTPRPDYAVADLSFRSMVLVVQHLLKLTKELEALVLIKPQFEWENPDDDFNGVISDSLILKKILKNVLIKLLEQGVFIKNIIPSGLRGRKGNQEFFMHISLHSGKTLEDLNQSIDSFNI